MPLIGNTTTIMNYYTFGLPTHQTLPIITYQFNIVDNHIYIPGDYVGRDQVGDPHYPEQAIWLNSLKNQIKIEEVWYGCWKLHTEKDVEEFINLLKISDVLITFSIDYEISGRFDKDEQGWCYDRISLICVDGKNVKIRNYSGVNDTVYADNTQDATINQKESQKIHLKYKNNNSKVILDLATQKLL